ncbi:hypothetical protein A2U01_0118880, partial [Trifolium medium]|nr:hypothetical protein [Trifolium medium]
FNPQICRQHNHEEETPNNSSENCSRMKMNRMFDELTTLSSHQEKSE